MSINELCELISKCKEDFVIYHNIYEPSMSIIGETYVVQITYGKDFIIRRNFMFSPNHPKKYKEHMIELVIEEVYQQFLKEYEYVKNYRKGFH